MFGDLLEFIFLRNRVFSLKNISLIFKIKDYSIFLIES